MLKLTKVGFDGKFFPEIKGKEFYMLVNLEDNDKAVLMWLIDSTGRFIKRLYNTSQMCKTHQEFLETKAFELFVESSNDKYQDYVVIPKESLSYVLESVDNLYYDYYEGYSNYDVKAVEKAVKDLRLKAKEY